MTALPKSEIRDLRPSVIIAEALVDRQGPTEIVDRARELGFSQCLTTAVVAACCRNTVPESAQGSIPASHQDQLQTS